MCGIIAAATDRSVGKLLIKGLYKMEYRGYDSAGIAMHVESDVAHLRTLGKVNLLEEKMKSEKPKGKVGIAHTRWATHGEPSEINAHPHQSNDRVFIVHNGIIENYLELKNELTAQDYTFYSKTDSELIAHLLDHFLKSNDSLLTAMQALKNKLEGAYAIAALDQKEPDNLVLARNRSPLVIGLGKKENFAASDPLALAELTKNFLIMEDGDVARISSDQVEIYDEQDKLTNREELSIDVNAEASSKGNFRHYMEKEIFEQPGAILNTLDGRIGGEDVLDNIFGEGSSDLLAKVKRVQIVACGTALHAGRVAANWFSAISGLPTQMDYASEYRYKNPYIDEDTLLIAISQSGETADTLAALRYAKEKDYLATLGICNTPTSSLAREADYLLLTNAGQEIGVASTKCFTTQLVALMLLTLALAKASGKNPRLRGYPIAKEGALKLKEISYIHAEAYPAGELKHGPLALIDEEMPVVAIAPEHELAEKLVSNLEEVKARGGALYVFGNAKEKLELSSGQYVSMPDCDFLLTPILYSIPLQILSYEVALLRGTDIDQPRNLAKSVTVE